MRPKRTCFLLIALWAVSSCNKDDGNECPAPQGELSARVHEDFLFTARFVEFRKIDSGSNQIWIRAAETTEDCILLGTLTFNLEGRTGIHMLKKGNSDEVGKTRFTEWQDDAVLGDWSLFETEPHSATITKLDQERIEGRFTATYVYEEATNNITTLPDTLRF